MKHTRWAIVWIVIASFGAAVSASAACAWVLWQENELSLPDDHRTWWEQHGAYTEGSECVLLQERIWEAVVKNAERMRQYGNIEKITKVAHGYVATSFKSGGAAYHKLTCLPDTIDLRGKR